MSERAQVVVLAVPAHKHGVSQQGQRTFRVQGARARGMAKPCAVRVISGSCEAPGDAHRPQERRARASCSGMRARGWAVTQRRRGQAGSAPNMAAPRAREAAVSVPPACPLEKGSVKAAGGVIYEALFRPPGSPVAS